MVADDAKAAVARSAARYLAAIRRLERRRRARSQPQRRGQALVHRPAARRSVGHLAERIGQSGDGVDACVAGRFLERLDARVEGPNLVIDNQCAADPGAGDRRRGVVGYAAQAVLQTGRSVCGSESASDVPARRSAARRTGRRAYPGPGAVPTAGSAWRPALWLDARGGKVVRIATPPGPKRSVAGVRYRGPDPRDALVGRRHPTVPLKRGPSPGE